MKLQINHRKIKHMRSLALVSTLITLLVIVTGFVIKRKTKINEPLITFYETPLVCNAAPNIGCGSRSKPILLELEKNPAIKEAWLNLAGTIIAIVWKDKEQTEAVAASIFRKNNVSFIVLHEKDDFSYRSTFRTEDLWYRGTNVDILSREEAATIA